MYLDVDLETIGDVKVPAHAANPSVADTRVLGGSRVSETVSGEVSVLPMFGDCTGGFVEPFPVLRQS